MNEYYQRTLDIKCSILQRPDLLDDIVKDYRAMHYFEGRAEAFERRIHTGTRRMAFRIGQLGEIWLAHKVPILVGYVSAIEAASECARAAVKFEVGLVNMPYFHMVVMHNGLPSTLTEDVTKGGSLDMVVLDYWKISVRTERGDWKKWQIDFKPNSQELGNYMPYLSEDAVLRV